MGTRTFSTLKKKLFVCIFPLLLITGFLLPVHNFPHFTQLFQRALKWYAKSFNNLQVLRFSCDT
jgi:hypothetical protein